MHSMYTMFANLSKNYAANHLFGQLMYIYSEPNILSFFKNIYWLYRCIS